MATAAIGVDTHKDTLAACLVDGLGIARDEQAFRNDPPGHAAFAAWVRELETPVRVGIEGSASFGSALARHLVAAGFDVVEVPPQLSRRERTRIRRPGKSDPGDAFAIARVTVAEADLPPVRLADRTRDLQLLAAARDAVVVAQTQARNRLHAHLVVLVPGYTATAARLVSGPELAAARRLLRGHHGVEADLARAEFDEVVRLGGRAAILERRLRLLVGDDPLLAIPGCGHLSAAVIRGETGDVTRFRSQRRVRDVRGHRPGAGFVGEDPPGPLQPARQPPGEPRRLDHRDLAGEVRPPGPHLPRTQAGRGQALERGHALPQAPPRPARLRSARCGLPAGGELTLDAIGA